MDELFFPCASRRCVGSVHYILLLGNVTSSLDKIFMSSICKTYESDTPAGNYLFKVNNRNTRARCETCSKLTIKTPKGLPWWCSGVFIVNSEHISHLVLVFLLLTWSR